MILNEPYAPVAQWIEQPPSKRSAGRSSRLGRGLLMQTWMLLIATKKRDKKAKDVAMSNILSVGRKRENLVQSEIFRYKKRAIGGMADAHDLGSCG